MCGSISTSSRAPAARGDAAIALSTNQRHSAGRQSILKNSVCEAHPWLGSLPVGEQESDHRKRLCRASARLQRDIGEPMQHREDKTSGPRLRRTMVGSNPRGL